MSRQSSRNQEFFPARAGAEFLYGTLAARPAFGVLNRYYWATDIYIIYRDTGAAWETVPRVYARYIWDVFSPNDRVGNTLFNPVGRVFLVPLQIRSTVTVDRIGFLIDVQAGNVRVAIYNDSGDTPAGAALVVESASVALGDVSNKQEVNIANTRLIPGLYWLAIQGDDIAGGVMRSHVAFGRGGTLQTYRFDNFGGYGAFENPQATALVQYNAPNIMFVRVASVP